LIEEMGNAVEPYGMETRVAEENLQKVFSRRISLFNGSDIFLQTFPHGNIALSINPFAKRIGRD